MRRLLPLLATGLAIALAAPVGGSRQGAGGEPIRVDQLGYAPHERRSRTCSRPAPVRRARSRWSAPAAACCCGPRGRSRGHWNRRFRAVQPLDLSRLRTPGTYRVRVAGGATSPPFRIAPPAVLFGPRVADAVAFFQAQRDGADVIPAPMHRKPAHLNDARHRLRLADLRERGQRRDRRRACSGSAAAVDLAGGWSTPATSSSSRTPRPTRRAAVRAERASWARGAAHAGRRGALRPGLAGQGLETRARRDHAARSASARATSAGRSTATTTCGGCRERDDALRGAAEPLPAPPSGVPRQRARHASCRRTSPAASPPRSRSPPRSTPRAQPARARAELATAAQVFAAAKTSDVQPRGRRDRAAARVLPGVRLARRPRARRRRVARAGARSADPRGAALADAPPRWAAPTWRTRRVATR